MNLFKRILILVLAIIIAFGSSLSVGAAGKDPILNYRKDFSWGVCMHTNYWGAAYKDFNMEDQIHLTAELGCKLIRTDGSASEEYLDKFVKLCNGYGIKVMLIGYFPNGEVASDDFDAKAITDHFFNLSKRYDGKHGNGKVDYIQIDNELDHTLMVASYPDGNYKDGKEISHYNAEYLKNYKDQVNAAIKGIKDSGTDAKIVINFVNDRYGLMDYFYQNGVEWDVTGMDWYSKIFHHGDTPFWLGDAIYKRYKKPIIICETNIHGKDSTFNENDESNFDIMVEAFKDFYSRDYVLGCCIYELSDELISNEDGSYNQEGHFGLLFTNGNGTIKGPKPHYYRYKKIFGGGAVQKIDWQRYEVAFDNGIEYVVSSKPEGSYSDFTKPETQSSTVSSSSSEVTNKTESKYIPSTNITSHSQNTTKTSKLWDNSYLNKLSADKFPLTALIIAVSATLAVSVIIAVVAVVIIKRRKKDVD